MIQSPVTECERREREGESGASRCGLLSSFW